MSPEATLERAGIIALLQEELVRSASPAGVALIHALALLIAQRDHPGHQQQMALRTARELLARVDFKLQYVDVDYAQVEARIASNATIATLGVDSGRTRTAAPNGPSYAPREGSWRDKMLRCIGRIEDALRQLPQVTTPGRFQVAVLVESAKVDLESARKTLGGLL